MHRLGKKSMLHNGVLKPSAPATGIGAPEATFTVVDGRRVWLGSEKLGAFQENERTITNLSRKLQLLNAERQARSFTSEEHQEYSGLQSQYAQCLEARRSLLDATQVREERVAVAAR